MEDKSFSELEQDLAAIMRRVEESDYDDLDDLLTDYDKGKKLIDELGKRLEAAKNTIKKPGKTS